MRPLFENFEKIGVGRTDDRALSSEGVWRGFGDVFEIGVLDAEVGACVCAGGDRVDEGDDGKDGGGGDGGGFGDDADGLAEEGELPQPPETFEEGAER